MNTVNEFLMNQQTELESLERVDLGLPSGNLWANINLGANSRLDIGNYYAWGEIEGKPEYNSLSYKYGKIPAKYNCEDKKLKLNLDDDAAYMTLGDKWRVPTYSDLFELMIHTNVRYIEDYKETHISVIKFTGKTGNSIILPASGKYTGELVTSKEKIYLWTSTGKIVNDMYKVYHFTGFNGKGNPRFLLNPVKSKWVGLPIRPVYKQFI